MSAEQVDEISMSIATTSTCKLNSRGIAYASKLKEELKQQMGEAYDHTVVYTR